HRHGQVSFGTCANQKPMRASDLAARIAAEKGDVPSFAMPPCSKDASGGLLACAAPRAKCLRPAPRAAVRGPPALTGPLVPSLFSPLFSSAAMRAVVDDRARLQRMLDFEAALARAEAAVGVIPTEAMEPIAAACKVDLYDLAALATAAPAAG